jgi:hypothetical protein
MCPIRESCARAGVHASLRCPEAGNNNYRSVRRNSGRGSIPPNPSGKKKARSTWDRAFPVCSAGGQEANPETGSLRCRAAIAAAYTAGVSPTEAAYSSPHKQSELVTDHLHFERAVGRTNGPYARGLAKPSRVRFEGACRTRFGRTKPSEDACPRAPGTPALVWHSTARRRALPPGNAFPGTFTRVLSHRRGVLLYVRVNGRVELRAGFQGG